ncbi:MAG TPA: HEAT repeat domain-containing protein, partial [bacterium]|nr:HEAT repeat domain-containing protein [bacterium]
MFFSTRCFPAFVAFILCCFPRISYADSARPPEKEEYFSANGEFSLTVDPGDWTSESVTRLILKSEKEGIILDVTESYFEKFRYPLHACVSNDAEYLVFGGVSCHNMGSGREGLRIYRRTGRLIRFIPMARLPYGFGSASTDHWYDQERCRINDSRGLFLLYTPGKMRATPFRLTDGRAYPKSRTLSCSRRSNHFKETAESNLSQTKDRYSDLPEVRVWGIPLLRLVFRVLGSRPERRDDLGLSLALLLYRQSPRFILKQSTEGSPEWRAVCYRALAMNATTYVEEDGTPLFPEELDEKHIRGIAESLASDETWVAEGATQLTCFVESPQFILILEKRLRDESLDPSLRSRSVQGYAKNTGTDAVPLLVELLENSEDDRVREQCARELGNLRDPRAFSALLRVADQESYSQNPQEREDLRVQSLIALRKIGDSRALETLENILRRK